MGTIVEREWGTHPEYFSEAVHLLVNWLQRCWLLSSKVWRPVLDRASVYEVYVQPRMMRHDLFWILSICCVCLVLILPCHTGQAYSTMGRTYPKYTETKSLTGTPNRFSLKEKPSFRAWPKNGVHTIVLGWFWIFEICRLKIWMMQKSHHWAF